MLSGVRDNTAVDAVDAVDALGRIGHTSAPLPQRKAVGEAADVNHPAAAAAAAVDEFVPGSGRGRGSHHSEEGRHRRDRLCV